MNGWLALFAWIASGVDDVTLFPNVPANGWIYTGIRELKRDGLLVGYPDAGIHSSSVEQPYRVALKVAFAKNGLRELARTTLLERESINEFPGKAVDAGRRIEAYNADRRGVLELRRHFDFFRRVEVSFSTRTTLLKHYELPSAPSVSELLRWTDRVKTAGPVRLKPHRP